ncbi:hypothetical protein DPMN_130524 [Dreissena polymorpha]|uniref:Uncharacterized protein n=1 Tax=Dreissena polymorpha TaxID=45954 RepID=A0A9D4K1U7_DREPO|nr:hypothetical protein DPMN_130524 [Dreissena polymorpha]
MEEQWNDDPEENGMDVNSRGERRGRSEEEDQSQLPRNKFRNTPDTASSPEHSGLSGMLTDSCMDELLASQSPHTY